MYVGLLENAAGGDMSRCCCRGGVAVTVTNVQPLFAKEASGNIVSCLTAVQSS